MKKINLISVIVIMMVVLLGCEKDEERSVVGTYTAPTWSTSGGGSYVFLEEDENETFQIFKWSAADFGFTAAVNYTVDFDITGNNFADPQPSKVVTDLELPTTVGEMNNALLQAGAVSGIANDVDFRVTAWVHKDVDTLRSPTISMTITPFEKIIEYDALYVPGSYQDEWDASLGWGEWDAGNENTKIYSVAGDGVYEGYLYFNEDTTWLKFTQVPAWEEDKTIGDPDASGFSGTLQVGSWGGNNIGTDVGPAYVLVKADLNDLESSFTATDWGLIGSATAGQWDSDEDMTYDPVTDTWSITTDLVAGEIKFRANDDWAINYGDPLGNGKLAQDGANIAIAAAGNYTITMDLSGAIYTYTVVQN